MSDVPEVVVRLSRFCLLLAVSSIGWTQTADVTASPEAIFKGSWALRYPAHFNDANEPGKPIVKHHIVFISAHDFEVHDVSDGQDIKSLGHYSVISSSKVFISFKTWNDDFGLTIVGDGKKMIWKDPSGEEWVLGWCSNPDCRPKTAPQPTLSESLPPKAAPQPVLHENLPSPIRRVDFRNFDYVTDACSEVGTREKIHVTNGRFTYHKGQPDEAYFTIPNTKTAIVYAPFFDPSSEEAVVTARCGMENSTGFSSEYFFFSFDGDSVQQIGHLTEQMLARNAKRSYPDYLIFEGEGVSVDFGIIAISFSAGKARCCQDKDVTQFCDWRNGQLVCGGVSIGALGSSSIKRPDGPSISGKVLQRYDMFDYQAIEIESGSGKLLLRPIYPAAAEPFIRPLKMGWNSTAKRIPIGGTIVGKDCSIYPTSIATSKIALSEGAKEAFCHRLENPGAGVSQGVANLENMGEPRGSLLGKWYWDDTNSGSYLIIQNDGRCLMGEEPKGVANPPAPLLTGCRIVDDQHFSLSFPDSADSGQMTQFRIPLLTRTRLELLNGNGVRLLHR
jgi:hypothetical protein